MNTSFVRLRNSKDACSSKRSLNFLRYAEFIKFFLFFIFLFYHKNCRDLFTIVEIFTSTCKIEPVS